MLCLHYCCKCVLLELQGLDNETETLANVGGFTSICPAANLQSEARVDQ